MFINLNDPELLRRIAEEEELERQIMERFTKSRDAMYVPRIDIMGEERRDLAGDDLYLALFSPQTTYTEQNGRLSIIKDEGTSTQESATVESKEVLRHISLDVRLKGDGVIAPLPPSRKDKSVSGQMKIAVDVALALDEVRPTDHVIVIGSAAADGHSGESYRLLAGAVSRVDLYDPGERVSQDYELEGTRFVHHPEVWPESKPVKADVVFVDAFDKVKKKACEFDVDSRVYSIKDARKSDAEPYRVPFFKRYPRAFCYVQLSDTSEWRYTSGKRFFGNYRARLGDCAACREVDYRSRREFSRAQYDAWVTMHSYMRGPCSIASHMRSVMHVYASTVIWRTCIRPVVLAHHKRGQLVVLNAREDPPRKDLQSGGYEWFDQIYVYEEREERDDDVDDRPPTARFPRVIIPPRSAVSLTPVAGAYKLKDSIEGARWFVLVVDTFVYALCVKEVENGPERWRRVDGVSRKDYVYGPVVSPIAIGSWAAYRFERCVAKGKNGNLLALRVLITRKDHSYDTLGGSRNVDATLIQS